MEINPNLAPIVLFVYARPEHTRKTVEALKANRLAHQSRLFVFCDGPKDDAARPLVEEVRRYVDSIDGFADIQIVKQEQNRGLAASIIAGVTKIVNEHGRVIVVEDDILTTPYFLDYMNDGLEMYKDDAKVASIHGHMYPLNSHVAEQFFLPSAGCWGWGTWARAWKDFEPDAAKLLREIRKRGLMHKFDIDDSYPNTRLLKLQMRGKVSSWAVRWDASNFLLKRLTLWPAKSFVKNIGLDGSGTHRDNVTGWTVDLFNGPMAEGYEPMKRIEVEVNIEALEALECTLRKLLPPPLIIRAFNKLRRIIRRRFQRG